MLAHRLANVLGRMSTIGSRPIVISEAVKEALENRKPVVALESTIISHGMPYPQNLECAKHLEKIVVQHKATPATIALIDSKIHVGLSQHNLERLAEEGSKGKVRKVSRRDLAYCLTSGEIGATTVSATMACAHMVGIDVFATGGIGGVHRGVEESWDISADLTELGRTPVTVVSAGIKSILDIPKTLEYLETEGVPVVTFNSDEFPAFYTDKSGVKTPLQLNTEKKIAELIFRSHQLRLQSGILVAVPNPNPADAKSVDRAIRDGLAQLKSKGIGGHQVTPFLLKRVSELTCGKSLEANLALVANNTKVAANIARELAQLKLSQWKVTQEAKRKPTSIYIEEDVFGWGTSPYISIKKQKHAVNRTVIIGGSAIDTYLNPLPGNDLVFGRSNPGKIRNTFGGVGRNIAQVAGRLGTHPYFITSLGDDEAAGLTLNYMRSVGVQPFPIITSGELTGKYVHVMKKNGDLALGVSDMFVNRHLTFDNIYESFFRTHSLLPGTLVEVDSNVPAAELTKLIPFLNEQRAIILYEGISVMCTRILDSGCLDQISLLKMNHIELGIYIARLKEMLKTSASENDVEFYMKRLFEMIGHRNNYANSIAPFRHLIVTHGEDGSDLHQMQDGKHTYKTYPVLKCNVVKTNGAGDTMTGTLLSVLAKQKFSLDECMKLAICGTKFAVETPIGESTISERISMENLLRVRAECTQL